MEICLEPIKKDHLKALFDARNAPEVLEWTPGDYPLDYGEFEAKSLEIIKNGVTQRQASFSIVVDGVPAGIIGHFPREGQDRTEIGYYIGKDWWGKGVMTKSIALCLEEMRKIGVKVPIYGCHAAANKASGKLLSGVGFQAQPDVPYKMPDGSTVMDKCWMIEL